MTYRAAAALQSALYGFLSDLPVLNGTAVLDAQPSGTLPETYILIGPEEVSEVSDKTGDGAEHRLLISVVSSAQGFLAAKEIAAALCDAMETAAPDLPQGRIVSIQFKRASARRLGGGATRRIDLIFRVRIEL